MAAELLKASDEASRSGTGHLHARQLRLLLDQPPATQKDSEFGLAVWHVSAYLVGTIDARDELLLSKAFDPRSRLVFQNVLVALSFASNRNFLATLENKSKEEITPGMERAAAQTALEWWQGYVAAHPTGRWDDAVISGFREAGYMVEPDLRSAQSQSELLRALDDKNPIFRYNAHRSFNKIYGTHFDLDIAFHAGKYALSFMDPSSYRTANESRMRQYWLQRLKPTATATPIKIAPADSPGTRAPAMPQQESLGDAGRRLRQQKASPQQP